MRIPFVAAQIVVMCSFLIAGTAALAKPMTVTVEWTFKIQDPLDSGDVERVEKTGSIVLPRTNNVVRGRFPGGPGRYYFTQATADYSLKADEYEVDGVTVSKDGSRNALWYGWETGSRNGYRLSPIDPRFYPGHTAYFKVDHLLIPALLELEDFTPNQEKVMLRIAGIAGNVRLPLTYEAGWVLGSTEDPGDERPHRVILESFTLQPGN